MAHRNLTEQRIEHIAGMMRRLRWFTGVSGKALAAEWRISVDRVKDLAAEASRRVRAEIVDVDAVQLTVCAALAKTLRRALQKGDARSVIMAARAWADITGATSPARHEVAARATGGICIYLPAEERE